MRDNMLHILLVDDEPYVVEDLFVTVPWQSLNIEHVHLAYSGMEALDIIKQHPIDIVVTDINMPQMSGLELIEAIKKDWKHIKCVLLTGYAEFEYAKQAIAQNVSDYLLKPLADEDFIATLQKIKLDIQFEWEQRASQQKTLQTLHEHLPMLRDKLLHDILQGRFTSADQYTGKATQLQLPFKLGDNIAFLVIRLEDFYQKHDMNSLLLFEYAIINVAVEMLQDHFHVWSCKDSHDYLVFMLTPKLSTHFSYENHTLETIAYHIQKNVTTIIGGEISVITTQWGTFFEQTRQLYREAITIIHQKVGQDTGIYLSTQTLQEEDNQVSTLQSLYDPPSLFHLFETNNWEAIESKLESIILELKAKRLISQEHINEAKNIIESAFFYYTHRNNKLLSEVAASSVANHRQIRTVEQLKGWAFTTLSSVKQYFDTDRLDKRSLIISKVQDYIKDNLHYVSLHSIADYINLHPVYLSKIFKSETGQRISDYIFLAKMEAASHLLLSSSLKVYQISEQLGYSNAHYFIKLFKEYSGNTPQEFRDNSQLQ